MADMPDQSHNLNAHPVAVLHRTLRGSEYAAQGGGQADFWNAQSEEVRQRYALALREAAKAAEKQGITLNGLATGTSHRKIEPKV